MKTDKIKVSNHGDGLEEALDTAENFAAQLNLSEREARRLRLLSEETLALVRSITGDFIADFWLDNPSGKNFIVHLSAQTLMNYVKKKQLIDASFNKQNAASVGILGKIRDIIENSGYIFSYTGAASSGYYVSDSFYINGVVPSQKDSLVWSLQKYREDINEKMSEEDEKIEQAADELEKSILAHLADDVRVAISGDDVNITIEKNFAPTVKS